jgi:hypothetical protein
MCTEACMRREKWTLTVCCAENSLELSACGLTCDDFGWDTVSQTSFCRSSSFYAYPVIPLVYQYYDLAHFDRRFCKQWYQAIPSCFPIKIVAIHFCYATTKSTFSLVLPMIQQIMGSYFRRRLAQHVGGDSQIVKALNEYGITHIHESLGGTIVTDDSWVDHQQRRQEFGAIGSSGGSLRSSGTKFTPNHKNTKPLSSVMSRAA